MTAWTAFASVAGVVTVLLLLLSHTTSQRFGDSAASSPRGRGGAGERPESIDAVGRSTERRETDDGDERREGDDLNVRGAREPTSDSVAADRRASEPVRAEEDVALPGGRERVVARELRDAPSLSQPMLLLNVALSQGVFGAVLVASAVVADVPGSALGVAPRHLTPAFALAGVVLGVALYVANEVGAALADAAGFGRSEELRELLAPESTLGWVVLFGGVLPIVAGFEELLFRGVLVGALSAGFGLSPWVLVVGSSVLFGIGHGAQGRLGVVVTTALGVVFAVAYVLSGSLLLVVVAHYLVNALEFVVHEWAGVEWV